MQSNCRGDAQYPIQSGIKKSPLGKVRAGMVQDSICGGLLARIRLAALR
jgi:hypothetical protein